MSASPSRSHIEVRIAAALGLAALACCGGDDKCGPGTAAADGLSLAGTGVDVKYAGLVASPNNDCPAVGAPGDVTSVTVSGTQVGSSFSVTLCIPRPDLLASTPGTLGTDVKIIDMGANIGNGCTLARSATGTPTGTVVASGLCGAGKNAAGFALTFDGVVPIKRTCNGTTDVLDLALTGTVAVSAPH